MTERKMTPDDKVRGFKAATRHLIAWHGAEVAAGVNDDRLRELLIRALGDYGGSSGRPDTPSNCRTATGGMRIWLSWDWPNHIADKPTFRGEEIVRMARIVYAIPDPDNDQLALF